MLDNDSRDVTTAAGLDDALIGIAQRCGQPRLAIYSVPAIIEILTDRDGMTEDEAHEFFSFNIEGAWVGETTPMFVHPCSADDLVMH